MSDAVPFEQYRGTDYLELLEGAQREGLYCWQEIVRLCYGGTVDGPHFLREQIYLRAETAEYVYSEFSPTTVDYRKGSRPFLEKVVAGLRLDGLPELERFLWLARFVRDLPDARAWDLGEEASDGGTEERLIEKRAMQCNEQSRLLIVLAQIAGFPARYIGHHIGGHGVTEVYIGGGWMYYDIRGKFFLKADGRPASTWDLMQDPGIIRRQPEWVMREIHPRYHLAQVGPGEWVRDPYAKTERSFFNPRECTGVANYFVADFEKFDYSRARSSEEVGRRVRDLKDRRNRARRELGMAWGY